MIWRETDADIARELRIAQHVAACWGCEAVKYPKGSRLDFYFKRERRLWANAEVKYKGKALERNYVGLDTMKLGSLVHALWTHSAPSFYVVELSDGSIHYVRAHQVCGYPVLVDGRRDRGDDEHDIEPYIQIPLRLFKPVVKDVLP